MADFINTNLDDSILILDKSLLSGVNKSIPKDIRSFDKGLEYHKNQNPTKESFFDVFINLSSGLNDLNKKINDLRFSCEQTELPGRNLHTVPQKIYGVIEEHPIFNVYNHINLTFICRDLDFNEKKIFESWIEYISPNSTYNFKYKDEYKSRILINQYSNTGELLYQCTLIDAFPINMNQLNLNWSSQDFHKLTVTFAYTHWESIFKEVKIPEQTGSIFNLGNLVRAAETGYNVYESFKHSKTLLGKIASASSSLPNFGDFSLSRVTSKVGSIVTTINGKKF